MRDENTAVSAHNQGTSTTGNRFGSSVESQAQLDDAATIAAGTDVGEMLNIYRLEPIAAPDDFRWDNAPSHGTVVVAARTAGDARIVAAGAELDFQEIDALPAEDVSTRHASAFRDEKLYSVVEIEHGRADLKRGILDGDSSVDAIEPTQI